MFHCPHSAHTYSSKLAKKKMIVDPKKMAAKKAKAKAGGPARIVFDFSKKAPVKAAKKMTVGTSRGQGRTGAVGAKKQVKKTVQVSFGACPVCY